MNVGNIIVAGLALVSRAQTAKWYSPAKQVVTKSFWDADNGGLFNASSTLPVPVANVTDPENENNTIVTMLESESDPSQFPFQPNVKILRVVFLDQFGNLTKSKITLSLETHLDNTYDYELTDSDACGRVILNQLDSITEGSALNECGFALANSTAYNQSTLSKSELTNKQGTVRVVGRSVEVSQNVLDFCVVKFVGTVVPIEQGCPHYSVYRQLYLLLFWASPYIGTGVLLGFGVCIYRLKNRYCHKTSGGDKSGALLDQGESKDINSSDSE